MAPEPDRETGQIRTLTPEACMELLTTTTVGRLAFVDDGTPQLVLVNFALLNGSIYFRTLPDGYLSRLALGDHPVAFGVDNHDDVFRRGWNVTVRGTVRRVEDRATVGRRGTTHGHAGHERLDRRSTRRPPVTPVIRRQITARRGILVAHDGSRTADRAFRTAVRLGAGFDARVTVVRVWDLTSAPRPDSWRPGHIPPLEDFAAATQAALERDVARVRAPEHVMVTSHVVHGNAANLLIDASRHVDLIVVGSRGRGGFAGLTLGSVSERVVRHSACPVLVDRGEGDLSADADTDHTMEVALLSELHGVGDGTA
jgi:nucleotide-binding universal stress UspA family protein/nitroimidazol reductase NimA-like FMN-containing flavoprotein (pyridoxamine 5'-phosphate oxidase superfamily)